MAKNLWKVDRGTQSDSQDGGGSPQPAEPYSESVGATLRARREERGEDLRYVAQMLRIRYPYLKAIEDGRPDELPGPTYAVGFVRTYADHLGLDSDKLVQRFKNEAAGLQTRADLHFPAPLPEGKIPSGAVLVLAVVLAAIVYGAWIYMSSQDQQVAEIVPQLPNRISEIIKGKTPGPGDAAPPVDVKPGSSVASANPEKAPVTDTPPTGAGKSKETRPSAAAAPPAVAPAPIPTQTPSPSPDTDSRATADTSGDTAVGSSASSASQESIPSPPSSSAPAGSETAESEVPPAPSDVTSDATSEQLAMRTDGPQPGSGTPFETGTPPAKVYGAENRNSRIVIHAAADSWVEVRDSRTDELLLTRVLFKGDSYRVPDRSGLTLLTGNAGGLRIAVDGEDIPKLGPLGAVRRNVMLEPGPLKTGTAVGGASGGGSGSPDGQPPFSGSVTQ